MTKTLEEYKRMLFLQSNQIQRRMEMVSRQMNPRQERRIGSFEMMIRSQFPNATIIRRSFRRLN